jgi:S1-C subfamily serine protease
MPESVRKNLTLTMMLAVPFIAFGQTVLTTSQIAKRVSPSVVVIQGKTDSGDVLGSGFIVSKDGKVVTNLHVIRDMKTTKVQLADGKVFNSLSVLAVDERRDLAIIKVSGVNLTALPLGESDNVTVGEPVVVVGSPLGLDATVTAGILSAIRDSGDGYKLLQTDAAVNHGNSGGPLVNANGLAIGVVSSIVRSDSAQGLNFAVPINYVRGLLDILHEPVTLEQMRRSISAASSPQDHHNEGPPLKETLGWLKEKVSLATAQYVASFAGEPMTVTVKGVAASFDSCNVVFGQVERRSKGDQDFRPLVVTSLFSVPLSVIDRGTLIPARVDPIHYRSGEMTYMVSTGSGSNVIAHETRYSGDANTKSEMVNLAVLFFNDESIARRVQEAFRHAADLCRKKEPF